MVASRNTVDEVLKVMLRYVKTEDMPKMIKDLKKIKGNASFVETVLLIETGWLDYEEALQVLSRNWETIQDGFRSANRGRKVTRSSR